MESRQEISWELHLHEDPAAGEGHNEAAKSYELKKIEEFELSFTDSFLPAYLQHGPIELGDAGGVGLVEDDEAEPAEREHEAGGQALHYVLPVDPVLHESDWSGMPPLVGGRPHGGRLHDHVVDDAPGHQEVGEQHHEQHLLTIGQTVRVSATDTVIASLKWCASLKLNSGGVDNYKGHLGGQFAGVKHTMVIFSLSKILEASIVL